MPSNLGKLLKGKNYMVVIPADSNEWKVQLLESVPELDQMKEGLNGGLLEIVPRFNKFMDESCIAFCDEEGKMKGLKRNRTAHFLWEQAVGRIIEEDFLVGPIMIIVGSPSFLARL